MDFLAVIIDKTSVGGDKQHYAMKEAPLYAKVGGAFLQYVLSICTHEVGVVWSACTHNRKPIIVYLKALKPKVVPIVIRAR